MMYHATYKEYLPSILKTGLGGARTHPNWVQSKEGIVYLSSDKDCALAMAEVAELVPDEVYNSGIVILEVDCTGLKLTQDRNVICDEPVYFEFEGVITPDRLKILF